MKPWLWIPPQIAHDLSPWAVEFYSLFHDERTPLWSSFSWQNLHFKNRLGLAGGVDKNADHLMAWQKIGCGFIEAGTVTLNPQLANPGKIFDRSLIDQALWNKMGFPSAGVEEFYYNARAFKSTSDLPLFINIGKNRDTSTEKASTDYVALIHHLHSVADAFVVNISSPNTKGLRDITQPEVFANFLQPIQQAQHHIEQRKPILLKLSPDLFADDLKRVLDISVEYGVDGFVLTNTTLSRATQKNFSTEGGVSGKPLAELSKKVLYETIRHLGPEKSKKLLISVGGVMTAADVFERIALGADLVEVYSALIFSGLHFFRKVAKQAHESTQRLQEF